MSTVSAKTEVRERKPIEYAMAYGELTAMSWAPNPVAPSTKPKSASAAAPAAKVARRTT